MIIQINMHIIWMVLSFWSNFKTVELLQKKLKKLKRNKNKNPKGLNNLTHPQSCLTFHVSFSPNRTSIQGLLFFLVFFLFLLIPFLLFHGFLSFPLYDHLSFPISLPFSLIFFLFNPWQYTFCLNLSGFFFFVLNICSPFKLLRY